MVKANSLLLLKSLLILICLVGGSLFVFYQPYKAVRKSTIDSLNAEQATLARQAVHGIEAFFKHYERVLNHLGREENIIDFNADGRRILDNFYKTNQEEIIAITRADARGVILSSAPENPSAVGQDVSHQAHNQLIRSKQEPVVSDVFQAEQGYRSVALAVPVFSGSEYVGSLTVFIPIERITRKYVANIVLGDEGYAWMIGRDGVELYCPVPGHVGKTVFETSGKFPTVIEMAESMMAGERGVTHYVYDRIRDKRIETILKHAVYHPVRLPNNHWSIVVATPEKQALAAISEFGRWWLTIFSILCASIILGVSYLIRSRYLSRQRRQQQLVDEKLEQNELLFQQIINNAHIPIVLVNLSGKIEFVNKKCEELYGYTLSDIPTTEDWFLAAYPDEAMRTALRERWGVEFSAAVEKKDVKQLSSLELPVVCKNGDTKDVYFDYTLLDERVAVTLTDMTEQKKLQREKEKLLERENRAKKMEVIGLMAGGVAHDLNNILSGIVSYPDIILAKLPEDNPLRKPLETMRESGVRAATVVEDLLTAARGAATNREVRDLNVLSQEYFNSPEHRKLMELHPGVIFTLRGTADNSVIECSPVHIKKSIMNLVTNGAEAIKGEGNVTVSTKNRFVDTVTSLRLSLPVGEYVVLSVEDNGMGVSPADLERIFEPFYTKKMLGRSGSGLGLAIVWNSIEDHGGKILVESGKSGTRFDLWLPLMEKDAVAQEEGINEESDQGRGEIILIVDDEPMLQEIASQILQGHGYVTKTVSSGEEAVEYLKSDSADLVLLDMLMDPGMNGRQTYEEILKNNPDQRAILVSGFSQDNEVKLAMDLGSGAFLKKPYSAGKLQKAVANELARDNNQNPEG